MSPKINRPGRGRPAASKEALAAAALDVFAKKGYFVTTVEDIAVRAHVGKGTLYRHFRDKEGILVYLMKHAIGDIKTQLGAHRQVSISDDPLYSLCKSAEFTLRYFQKRRKFFRIIVQESLTLKSARHLVSVASKDTVKRYASIISRLPKDVRPPVSSVRSCAEMFNTLIYGILRQHLIYTIRPFDPARTARRLVDMLIYGMKAVR